MRSCAGVRRRCGVLSGWYGVLGGGPAPLLTQNRHLCLPVTCISPPHVHFNELKLLNSARSQRRCAEAKEGCKVVGGSRSEVSRRVPSCGGSLDEAQA